MLELQTEIERKKRRNLFGRPCMIVREHRRVLAPGRRHACALRSVAHSPLSPV
jgi:hypothetical protein